MKTCVNCGRILDDQAIICPDCATFQPLPPRERPSLPGVFFSWPGHEDADAPDDRALRNYLIWSLILVMLCSLFGFPGLMAAMQAYAEPDEEDRRRMTGYARTFCIIGTILSAGTLLVLFWLTGGSSSAGQAVGAP